MTTEQPDNWTTVYPSGDELCLEKFNGMYDNVHYVFCWRLAYKANIDDEMQVKADPEYFPVSDFERAKQAFEQRGKSEYPGHASGLGMTLAEIAHHNTKYWENDLLPISEVAPFPPDSNPYMFDRIRSGISVTSSLELMFSDVDSETFIPSSVVLANKITGRRFLINLQNFNQTLEERIEAVEKAAAEPINEKIETLEDLRQRLNKMTTEELSRPAIAVFADRTTFTRITSTEMTDLNHPLIQDQQVLVLTKGK